MSFQTKVIVSRPARFAWPDRNTSGQAAFTLIELLVVIAIIAVLAAILFPVFAQAKAAGKAASCTQQMRQIGIATELYLGDSDDTFPLNTHYGIENAWITALQPYVRSKLVVRCPVDESANFENPLNGATEKRYASYGVSYWFSPQDRHEDSPYRGYIRVSMVANPGGTIYMAETRKNVIADHFHPPLWYPDNFEGIHLDPKKELALTNHLQKAVYLFLDWHVKVMPFSQTFSGDHTTDLYDPTR